MNMKQRITLLFLIFMVVSSILGQFSFDMELSTLYDDNLFRSPYKYEDLLTNIDIRLSYQFSNTDFHIYYSPEFILFRDYTDRNFSMHTLGINYLKEFGSDQQHSWYIGSNYLKRLNGDGFELYDYNQIYAYLNLRLDLELLFLKTGYNFRYRYYLDNDYSVMRFSRELDIDIISEEIDKEIEIKSVKDEIDKAKSYITEEFK